jgi:putative transposase
LLPPKASKAKTCITAGENRFGRINILPKPIEWLTDNCSCFIAKDTKSLLLDIGMEPCSTPVRSPQSNGMAEAFVKTFKRDYVAVNPVPDAETVIAQLPLWFEHYNTLHPHNPLAYPSPPEFLNRQSQI